MRDGLFISYRRDDASGEAGRIHDRLLAQFGEKRLFMDVDAVPLGSDFLQAIKDALEQSGALIAVIGPRWLAAEEKLGGRRLDDPKDVVRAEISMAIKLGIPIFPVILNNAIMPGSDDLPYDIKPMALRNALHVRHSSFHTDVTKLVEALEGIDGSVLASPPEQKAYRYVAVLTHAHRDRLLGFWLHKALERYKVPAELVGKPGRLGPIPRRLLPIFADQELVSSYSVLTDFQITALSNSSSLIILCSTAAGNDRRVNAEAELMLSLGRVRDIIPVLVEGSVAASQESPFPPALRPHIKAGRLRFVDARGLGGAACLHVIVPRLVGVPTSYVLTFEERRRRRRLIAYAVLASGAALAAGGYLLARVWM